MSGVFWRVRNSCSVAWCSVASAGDKARADREPGSETLVGVGRLGTGAVVLVFGR